MEHPAIPWARQCIRCKSARNASRNTIAVNLRVSRPGVPQGREGNSVKRSEKDAFGGYFRYAEPAGNALPAGSAYRKYPPKASFSERLTLFPSRPCGTPGRETLKFTAIVLRDAFRADLHRMHWRAHGIAGCSIHAKGVICSSKAHTVSHSSAVRFSGLM